MPFSAAGRLFWAKIGAFIGQKLGPGPPKFPYSQVGWAPPSGKIVYSHTRNSKNAMVYGAQCSITVLPGSRFFYCLFFASGPPKPALEPSPDPGPELKIDAFSKVFNYFLVSRFQVIIILLDFRTKNA